MHRQLSHLFNFEVVLAELLNNLSLNKIGPAAAERPADQRLREVGRVKELAAVVNEASEVHPLPLYRLDIFHCHKVSHHLHFAACHPLHFRLP